MCAAILCQIFADSKFLREEALLDLVRAVIWAASGFQRAASAGDDSDTEQVLLKGGRQMHGARRCSATYSTVLQRTRFGQCGCLPDGRMTG